MIDRLRSYLLRVPTVFRNVFFLAGATFAGWMLFFDENNMIVQYHRRHQLSDLSRKATYYRQEIARVDNQIEQLTTNSATQERYARENYMMKKDSEDVFVIVQR
ncbi:MAG: septum formation initiator family protein [Bacteroidetes bacterium]|nr:septum formation initiator family protein [Bacteroidota bacterium]